MASPSRRRKRRRAAPEGLQLAQWQHSTLRQSVNPAWRTSISRRSMARWYRFRAAAAAQAPLQADLQGFIVAADEALDERIAFGASRSGAVSRQILRHAGFSDLSCPGNGSRGSVVPSSHHQEKRTILDGKNRRSPDRAGFGPDVATGAPEGKVSGRPVWLARGRYRADSWSSRHRPRRASRHRHSVLYRV